MTRLVRSVVAAIVALALIAVGAPFGDGGTTGPTTGAATHDVVPVPPERDDSVRPVQVVAMPASWSAARHPSRLTTPTPLLSSPGEDAIVSVERQVGPVGGRPPDDGAARVDRSRAPPR